MENEIPIEQMPTKLYLPGEPDEIAGKDQDEGLEDFLKIEVRAKSKVTASTRGSVAPPTLSVEADANDVVELEFEGGVRQLVPVKHLDEYIAQLSPQMVSEKAGKREVIIPATLGVVGDTRAGFKDLLLKGLKVISANVPSVDEIKDLLKEKLLDKLIDLPVTAGARGLAIYLEGWGPYKGQLAPGPGLYRFPEPQKMGELITKASELNSSDPYLLFLHGTASSSTGSFGKLSQKPEWGQIKSNYSDRIIAFNHPTLSLSPIENAIELVKLLPPRARLHLVSHSRGGLVGELLCLPPATGQKLANLTAPFTAQDRKKDEENMRELMDLLGEKSLQIERFVRVACPARGTILASGRLDLYLSTLLKALGYATGWQISPTYNFIKAFLVGLVKKGNDPNELPGLEAMNPDSPLIKMLNRPDLTSSADLSVIAGDIEGADILKNLLVGVTNLFYLEKHDLVVNTEAMYGGIKREKPARFFFDQGSTVSHFNYFENQLTREKLWNGLSGQEDPGFKELKRGDIQLEFSLAATRDALSDSLEQEDDKPVVFVLPGIMGSHLKDGSGQVWFNPAQLAFGGMERLAVDGINIAATGLVAQSYDRLVRFLKGQYQVIPFAYDWRQSAKVSGDELAKAVKQILDKDKKDKRQRTIRFLAHSMGGLVTRAMIVNHEDLWKEVCSRGGRLVMLGTPNHGSFAIPRMLLGKEKLVRLLALLDLKHGQKELVSIIGEYPGVLEMLPIEYLEAKQWDELCKGIPKDMDGAKSPSGDKLKAAKAMRDSLAKAVAPQHMVYVAGSAEWTPFQIVPKNGKAEFVATPLGDGRVTYELGKLDGVEMWFMDAEHGDMANHEPSFPAFIDLLETGETTKLSRTQRIQRSDTILATKVLEEDEPLLFPTEEELAAAAFGSALKRVEGYTLRVSVAHGNLVYASYPVAVGHYQGDSIVSAESALDKALQGRLTQRFHAGIYPGAKDTAAAIYAPNCDPPGALIVGLGEVGQLTQEDLRDGVARAALHNAMAILEAPECERSSAPGWRSAAFSSLLLGTYGGTHLEVDDSVSAIVQGALIANRALQTQNLWDRVRIDEVEIIELYEDVAIQAVRAAYAVAEKPPLAMGQNEKIEIVQQGLISKEGGRFQRPADQYAAGWWRRIQITGDGTASEAIKGLHFLSLTDRARAEDYSQATQRRLVDKFITQAIQTSSSAASEKLGLTLFELLVPNLLKEQASVESDLLLVLDKDAAQYPWELLAERSRSKEPRALALSKGMIRQYKTADFRPNPRSATDRNVLVIGDTVNNISPLPGARREAEEVANTFKNHKDYGSEQVTSLIGQKADEIIINLFSRDYNIIHLAGHGLYDPANPEQSGMVLSEGLCLSTAEIKQLRVVPDLVFINCCHLGRIDQSNEDAFKSLVSTLASVLLREGAAALNAQAFALADKIVRMGLATPNDHDRLQTDIARELIAAGLPEQREPNKLAGRIVVELVRLQVAQNAHNIYASSIAEELIKMGVKAVVAAGWAVDDAAALTFAKTFYQQMLGGGTFGTAVQMARKTTHDKHSGANTWGAYQCYGTPDFRLILPQSASSWKGRSIPLLSQHEYIDSLRNLAAEAKNADMKKRQRLEAQLETLRQEIQPRWLEGRTYSAFAEAWSELGDFEKALEYYRLAVESEKASLSFHDIEQMANLETRYARQLHKTEQGKRKVHALFNKSEKLLKQLLEMGKTAERLSLLGSHYKKRAQVESKDRNEMREWLEKAADYYGQAHQLKLEKTNTIDPYSTLNWIACRFLLGTTNTPEEKANLVKRIDEILAAAASRQRVKTDFWDRITEADARLLLYLIKGDLEKVALGDQQNRKYKDFVIAAFQRALATGGSQREVSSVSDQLDYLITGLSFKRTPKRQPPEIESLRQIRDAVQKAAQS